jgi:TetR/AcrR family transcriptional regulator, transcriptional repressor for nem operon
MFNAQRSFVPTGQYMTPTAPTITGSRLRDGRQTREAILEAATKLMHLKGYQATSLDDVLRESGVGKGNFYYHFKSKEDLGYAILDQAIAAFLGKTVEPCFSDPSTSRLAQIRCFFTRVLAAQRARNCVGGCAFGNLAAELSDVHEGFRERLSGVFSAWQARLTQALADAQGDGSVRPQCRPETVAEFLVASLEGAILMTKLTKDIAVMERCIEELDRYLTLYEVKS